MTKSEIATILGLIEQSFRDFKLTEKSINTWFILFEDENYPQVFQAFKHYINNSDSSFSPKPTELKQIIKKLFGYQQKNAAISWQSMIKKTRDDITMLDAEAWKLWGGDERFGRLPDPKNSPNPAQAESTIAFARKEYIELYEALSDKSEVETTRENLKLSPPVKKLVSLVIEKNTLLEH